MDTQEFNEVEGKPIGGWLWLIGVFLILSFLVNVVLISFTLGDYIPFSLTQFREIDTQLQSTWVMSFAFLLYAIVGNGIFLSWSIYTFFKRRKTFPYAFMGYVLFSLFNETGGALLSMYLTETIGPPKTDTFQNIIKVVIFGVLGGAYLFYGKRPQETFVK